MATYVDVLAFKMTKSTRNTTVFIVRKGQIMTQTLEVKQVVSTSEGSQRGENLGVGG